MPVRTAHRWFATYRAIDGDLFAARGPSPYDVEQGEAGTCWLLAAMAATAHQQPERIRALFQPAAAGAYRVTFAAPLEGGRDDGGRPAETLAASPPAVTVTTRVPHTWLDGPLYARSRHGTWVSLLEKAYAQAFAPDAGYEGIGGQHPRTALARLTGWRVEDFDVDGDLSAPAAAAEWRYLLDAYRAGAPMVAGSRIYQARPDLVPMHAYAITGLWEDAAGDRYVALFDPEGLNADPLSEARLSFEEFDDYFFYVSIARPEPASPSARLPALEHGQHLGHQ